MAVTLYLPTDSITSHPKDFNIAADFLELSAFLSETNSAQVAAIKNNIDIGASEEPVDVDGEMHEGSEEVLSATVDLIDVRGRALGPAYPYKLDEGGDILECVWKGDSLGQTAYVLCLILSNLRSISPILDGSAAYPDETQVSKLRVYFQYFATVALAAEIRGASWSFGFPRLDHSSFLTKLKEIWQVIGDGRVEAQIGSPTRPKDDQVDVFAARPHPDNLPGFLIAAAQVATGHDWQDKSLRGHLDTFRKRWFGEQPATDFIPYMIVPFARSREELIDNVRVMGNMLHRLRVPRKVEEATQILKAGFTIEAFDRLEEAVQWVADYRSQAA